MKGKTKQEPSPCNSSKPLLQTLYPGLHLGYSWKSKAPKFCCSWSVTHTQSSTAQLWEAPPCNSVLFIIPLLSAQLSTHRAQINNEIKRWILGPRNVYFPRTYGFNPTASSEAAWSLFPWNSNTQFFTPYLIYCPQIWACVWVVLSDTLVLVVHTIWIDCQKMHICFTAKMKCKIYFQLHHFPPCLSIYEAKCYHSFWSQWD